MRLEGSEPDTDRSAPLPGSGPAAAPQSAPPSPPTGGPVGSRLRARGLQLLLAAAILLPAITLAGIAWLSWRDTWVGAEREIARSAEAAAEYARRTHGGHLLAADIVNDLLRDLSDADIRTFESDLHEELARLLPRMPLVHTVLVTDRNGRLLLTGHARQAPRGLDLSDREWMQALRPPDAPAVHVSRVQTGLPDLPLFYAVSRRRGGASNGLAAGTFDGVVSVAVDPNRVAAGFVALGGEPGDITALVRRDGDVLVRTPIFDRPLPAIAPDSPLRRAAHDGAPRGSFVGQALEAPPGATPPERLIAFRQVADQPLYVTVARPAETIVARWQHSLLRQLAIGIPASAALAGLAMLALLRTRAADSAEAALRAEMADRAAAEARRAAEARFRGVFESRIVGMAVFDAASGRTLLANDRLREMTGHDRGGVASDGWDWRRASPPDQLGKHVAAIQQARQRGWWEPYEAEFLRPDGSCLAVRISSAPLPGEPGRLVVLVQDISEQREAELRRDLLRREVDHRARNAIATARAALRLTRARSVEEFIERVDGRIGALAQALSLLAETGWRGADLATLVQGEMTPYLTTDEAQGPRVALDGPKLAITAAAVQPLAMALHELATNAAKYGALARPDGRVTLRWRLEDSAPPALHLIWQERGGPPVAGPPPAGGFGTRVLDATVRRQLGGQVVQHWDPAGLVCDILLPADRVLAATPSPG